MRDIKTCISYEYRWCLNYHPNWLVGGLIIKVFAHKNFIWIAGNDAKNVADDKQYQKLGYKLELWTSEWSYQNKWENQNQKAAIHILYVIVVLRDRHKKSLIITNFHI